MEPIKMKKKSVFIPIALAGVMAVVSPSAIAQPAPAFVSVLREMRQQLPAGWVVRLPADIRVARLYDAKLFAWNGNYEVLLTFKGCEGGSNNCIAGRIGFAKADGSPVGSGQTIQLANGVRGIYGQDTGATGTYRILTWRQDNMTYNVNGRLAKAEVIAFARSMATQRPIVIR